jgi:hypothetical protein
MVAVRRRVCRAPYRALDMAPVPRPLTLHTPCDHLLCSREERGERASGALTQEGHAPGRDTAEGHADGPDPQEGPGRDRFF